jgi:hypothetical protein
MDEKKVEVFDLSNMMEKDRYEKIMNEHHVIREEFAYMRDGTAKVTVWYIDETA